MAETKHLTEEELAQMGIMNGTEVTSFNPLTDENNDVVRGVVAETTSQFMARTGKHRGQRYRIRDASPGTQLAMLGISSILNVKK
jgi:hypothetical protein